MKIYLRITPYLEVTLVVVDGGVEAQLPGECVALLLTAGYPDHPAALDPDNSLSPSLRTEIRWRVVELDILGGIMRLLAPMSEP